MKNKKQWLLNKILIPAGIIPPTIKPEDLQIYENSRKNINALGFEYLTTIQQDISQIKNGPLGPCIKALHSPWVEYDYAGKPGSLQRFVAENFVLKNKKFPEDFLQMAEKCFEYAAKLNVRIVVFHIRFFNHNNLEKELNDLSKLQRKYKISAIIEHDDPYDLTRLEKENSRHYKRINGGLTWMCDPKLLLNFLDKVAPNEFNLCIDTAALIAQEIPLTKTIKSIFNRVAHVHLAGNVPGGDYLALEISQPEIIEVVNLLYDLKYQGLITIEIAPYIGNLETKIAKTHAALSLFNVQFLKKYTIEMACKHIENSCRFLLDNI